MHAVYDRIADVLAELGHARVDAVLFDLGVSSLQLDAADRGFSYARDADLDMRMDPTSGPTAADVLNTYPVPRLARILREYGEERFAGRIAAAVGRRRQQAPLRRSAELVELLYGAVPAASRRTGGHPAKRTFQALRIEVNGELDALEARHPGRLDALRVDGRIVVLAYHSLEDRIVKRELAVRSRSSAPPDLPVELPEHRPELRLLVRGAEQAGRAGDQRQPARRLGAAAGGRTSPGGSSMRTALKDSEGDGVVTGNRTSRAAHQRRYATSARSGGASERACERVDVTALA